MRIRLPSVIVIGALMFAACSTGPTVSPVDTAAREAEARAAFERGEFSLARELYVRLNTGTPRAAWQIEIARAEVALDMPEAAIATLDAIVGVLPDALDSERMAVRASAYFAVGRVADAVRLLIEREIWLDTNDQVLANQALIWDGLAANAANVASMRETGDTTIDGWLALAPIVGLSTDDPAFLDGLVEWREVFPNHPAAGGILASRLAASRGLGPRPGRIALLLPLGSELRPQAEAIREGFLSAHFEAGLAGQIDIRVYDTAQRGAVQSFLTAQIEGADFIVGPLTQDEVAEVAAQPGFIPTLALNQSPAQTSTRSNFYQFALSSDDELEAIASRAIASGHETAIALYASSNRGYRQMDRFREAFESRGGVIIEEVAYVRDAASLTARVEEALNIADSNARYQQLRSIIGRGAEFQPRRRADIDMIFLQTDSDPVSGPAEARLIVPLLRDNGADPADVPTFTTSDIYDPARGASEPDLDDLVFPDLPLLISPGTSAAPAAASLVNFTRPGIAQQPRLFAFGFDAYQLATRLFSADASWPLNGATGELYLDAGNRIRRILPFASFRRGRPEPLGSTAESFGSR